MTRVSLNGEEREIPEGLSITALLDHLGLEKDKIAVERNRVIVKKPDWGKIKVESGDNLEVVTFVGGGAPIKGEGETGRRGEGERENLIVGKHEFRSRLMLGTGKYRTMEEMESALEASGAEVITVAVRRMGLGTKGGILDHIDRKKYTLLPNTAACYNAEEAVRTARLGREAGLSDLVKLEVIGDEKTLLPDVLGLLQATEILAKEGFTVLPYTNDDPIIARRLVNAGAAAVMPLAAPIGSGLGIQNPLNIRFVKEAVKVPVIVDAGVGTASDAAVAMELGADGILMNTGVALARDPRAMAEAMNLAVKAGRLAYQAGRMTKKEFAEASSPAAGKIS